MKLKSALLLMMLLIVVVPAAFSDNVMAADPTITLNKSITHQTMTGFGAAENIAAWNLMEKVSAADQKAIFDFLYTQSGIGLSMLRMQINPYLKTDSGTNGKQATIEPSQGVWDFDTDQAQKWFAKQAISRGVSRFFALPWSPPAWMKTTGKVNKGGTLKPTMYGSFAEYLERYILHYDNVEGIPIQWLSLQNEPNAQENWAVGSYDSNQLNALIERVAGQFHADALPSLLVGPEAGNSVASADYLRGMNPSTLGKLDVLSTHGYGAPAYDGEIFNHDKEVWMSEHCCFGRKADDTSITDGIRWANQVQLWIERGASAYLYWRTVDDNPVAFQLVNYSSKIPWPDAVPKRSYTFGQFSRFVRPGYLRIDSVSSAGSLKTSAFINPVNNKAVLVVINNSKSDMKAAVKGLTAGNTHVWRTSSEDNLKQLNDIPVSAGSLTAAFPAQSVTTIVEDVADSTSPPDAVSNLTAGNSNLGVRLAWKATGSNGKIGMANKYGIRYSTSPITSSNFSSAVKVAAEPPGLNAGSEQSYVVTGLNDATTYYFALKAYSESGLESGISNVANVTTPSLSGDGDSGLSAVTNGFETPSGNNGSLWNHWWFWSACGLLLALLLAWRIRKYQTYLQQDGKIK